MNGQVFHCIAATLLGLGLAGSLFWLGTLPPARAGSDVRCVNGSGTGCDAVCGGGCYASVQAAVDGALPGDQIRIAAGTYTDPAGTVATINKELVMHGGYGQSCGDADFDPDLHQTVLDAQWGGSVISITDAGDVSLLHLTLTHGDGSGNCNNWGCGGGIYATGTSLHVGHCIVADNVASKNNGMGLGGGIYAYAPNRNVEIWASRVISNTGNTSPSSVYYSYGGGIFLRYGTAMLRENEVLANVGSSAGTGGMGGGIYLYNVTQADVLTNTIRGNVATAHNSSGDGGGIYIFGFKAYLAGNRIENNWTAPNWAGYGGGVFVSNQTEAHLTRNTIINNATAPSNTGFLAPGGGVFIASSEPVTLSNNLIARNSASDGAGGGVYVDHDAPAGPVLLVNNTIADNGGSGVVVWRYAALVLTNNLIAGHTVGVANTAPASSTVTADTNLFWNTSDPIVGSNPIQQDPLLTADYHLQPGSPAVDAGLTIPWLTVDLDGNARPQGPKYDIGACEGVRREVFLPLVLKQERIT